MSGVKRFMPENRLAKALGDSNGVLFEHALQRASKNLAEAREGYEAALDQKLAQLSQAAAAGMTDKAQVPRLYRLAQDINTDAGQLGHSQLADAAKSLCDLLSCAGTGARFWAGVTVHREALSALRALPKQKNSPLADDVLKGLRRLSQS